MPRFNTRSPAVKRIMREAKELSEATYDFHAAPLEEDLFEWHFTIRGPSETEFEGGVYHGRIILPAEYPLKPPSIILLTPNGRFETNKKICLSMSDYHPETWQPSWSIRTVLVALISFFPTKGQGAVGALDCSAAVRKDMARKSREWRCAVCECCPITLLKADRDEGVEDETKALASELLAFHNPGDSAATADTPVASAVTSAATENASVAPSGAPAIKPQSSSEPARPSTATDSAEPSSNASQSPQLASIATASTSAAGNSNGRTTRSATVMPVTPPPNDQGFQVLIIALLVAIAALLYKISIKD